MERHIDRRTFLTAMATALAASPALAQFSLPGLNVLRSKSDSGDDDSGGGDLISQADHFQKYVGFGSKSLLSAIGAAAAAIGQKDLAAQYAAAADTIKGGMSTDDFKRVNPLIANASLKPEDLQKAKLDATTKAREHLAKSFIHFTIGGAMDKKATMAAKSLLTSKPSTAEMANKALTGAIAVAKLASDALPTHVSTSAKWLSSLTTYMRDNGVKIPSKEEAQSLAKAEGAPADLVDAAFRQG
jgi:hypothetical protein